MDIKGKFEKLAKAVFGNGPANWFDTAIERGTPDDIRMAAATLITHEYSKAEARDSFFNGIDRLPGMIDAEGTDFTRLAMEIAVMPFARDANGRNLISPENALVFKEGSSARLMKMAPDYAAIPDPSPIPLDLGIEKMQAGRIKFALESLLAPTVIQDETSNELRDTAIDLINNYGKQDPFGASRLAIRYFAAERSLFSDEINAKIPGPDQRSRDFQ